jgi:6-phosphogluconate dehydrogenase (decarboxylating)
MARKADPMSGKPTVGFVGVGNMGWPMAACLVRAGFVVQINDSRREVANNFAQQIGGTAPDTLRQLADVSDVVITMLPTSAIVAAVLGGGDDNVFAGLKPGTIVIEMSSGIPSVTQELAEKVAALGGHMIDAPVSGGVPRAKDGRARDHGWGRQRGDRSGDAGAVDNGIERAAHRRGWLRPGDEGAEQFGFGRWVSDRHRGVADRPAVRA